MTWNGLRVPQPPYRRLRCFAFDPILSRQLDTYEINEVTLKIPWDDSMGTGPVDRYLEVVDYDPASRAFYAPVDLGDPKLLAQDGLPPSEGNPQFHQQMAYAVARTTIRHFELALGRCMLWSSRESGETSGVFVERLRIYPHALREANAYYSPEKKALLFGYFPASAKEAGRNMPGETVFTCLSHDIIAHETTHALIDGIHPRFLEPSNIDVWALHEAIADVVALFQHFTYPDVLKHQIAETRGDLERQNLLGQLAYQFGQALGHYGALRSAIGDFDPATHKWVPKEPDPSDMLHAREPHDRGAILVAAIFDAFLAIYKSRIRDLLSLASGGTGIMPAGNIHPDLVQRLSDEAAKTATHMLHMCIRALDYCPPVDIDFGDYLRALITADLELVTDDRYAYRLALIEAFRKRGIYPRDIRNLSVESLTWYAPTEEEQNEFSKVFPDRAALRALAPDWEIESDREKLFFEAMDSRERLHDVLMSSSASGAAKAARLTLNVGKDSLYRDKDNIPTLEIHSVRPARRIGPNGRTMTELVVEITQRRRGYFDVGIQEKVDKGLIDPPEPDFTLRGGCTLLVDPATARVRYCIYKDVSSANRLNRMRDFLEAGSGGGSLRMTYFGDPLREYFRHVTGQEAGSGIEPFAFLHRHAGSEEGI